MCFEFRRDTKISGLFMYKNQKAVLESDLFSKRTSKNGQGQTSQSGLAKRTAPAFLY